MSRYMIDLADHLTNERRSVIAGSIATSALHLCRDRGVRGIVTVCSISDELAEALDGLRNEGTTIQIAAILNDGGPDAASIADMCGDAIVVLPAMNSETGTLTNPEAIEDALSSSRCLGVLIDATDAAGWTTIELSGDLVIIPESSSALTDNQRAASERIADLRDHLESSLIQRVADTYVNGSGSRIANLSSVSFRCVNGEMLMAKLRSRGIAVTTASRCYSKRRNSILAEMDVPFDLSAGSIRFCLKEETQTGDIETVVRTTAEIVGELRG
jgi:cysteine sulfinate desulfinase/cysteine desulfurase-like protein